MPDLPPFDARAPIGVVRGNSVFLDQGFARWLRDLRYNLPAFGGTASLQVTGGDLVPVTTGAVPGAAFDLAPVAMPETVPINEDVFTVP